MAYHIHQERLRQVYADAFEAHHSSMFSAVVPMLEASVLGRLNGDLQWPCVFSLGVLASMEGLQILHSTSAHLLFLECSHCPPPLRPSPVNFKSRSLGVPVFDHGVATPNPPPKLAGVPILLFMSRNRDYAMPSDFQTGPVWMKVMVERPLPFTFLSTFAPALSSFSYRPLLLHSPHQVMRQN